MSNRKIFSLDFSTARYGLLKPHDRLRQDRALKRRVTLSIRVLYSRLRSVLSSRALFLHFSSHIWAVLQSNDALILRIERSAFLVKPKLISRPTKGLYRSTSEII